MRPARGEFMSQGPATNDGATRALAVVLADVDATLSAEGMGLAVTHRSFAYENGGLPTNERLEFLGDAVLGLIVTESLYLRYPDVA
jgi:ribonuclease III